MITLTDGETRDIVGGFERLPSLSDRQDTLLTFAGLSRLSDLQTSNWMRELEVLNN